MQRLVGNRATGARLLQRALTSTSRAEALEYNRKLWHHAHYVDAALPGHKTFVKVIQLWVGAPETGSFDDATCDAVAAFQGANGLQPDGKVGPVTLGPIARRHRDHASEEQSTDELLDIVRMIIVAHRFDPGRLSGIDFVETIDTYYEGFSPPAETRYSLKTGEIRIRFARLAFGHGYVDLVRVVAHELEHVRMYTTERGRNARPHVHEYLAVAQDLVRRDLPQHKGGVPPLGAGELLRKAAYFCTLYLKLTPDERAEHAEILGAVIDSVGTQVLGLAYARVISTPASQR